MNLKKFLKIGTIAILILFIGVLSFGVYRSITDPLKGVVDDIVDSLEERDKETFDKYVDLEEFAESVSSEATDSVLEDMDELSEEDKKVVLQLFGGAATEENKKRYIKETEKYFAGQKEELVGPLQFLKINGGSNRGSEYNENSAKMIYTPPRGADGTKMVFLFEERDEIWVMVGFQKGLDRSVSKDSDNNEIATIDGKKVYKKKEDGKEFLVVGDEEQTRYDEVNNVITANGELAYIAKDGDQEFIVVNGQEKREYDDVGFLREIGGKLGYIAEKEGKEFVVWGGEEQKGRYTNIIGGTFQDINGKPAYHVVDLEGGREEFVVHGEREYRDYDRTSYLKNVNDELVFKAVEDRREFIVYGGGERRGKKYDNIRFLRVIDNKLAYRAEEDGEKFIVHDGKEHRDYEDIHEYRDSLQDQ